MCPESNPVVECHCSKSLVDTGVRPPAGVANGTGKEVEMAQLASPKAAVRRPKSRNPAAATDILPLSSSRPPTGELGWTTQKPQPLPRRAKQPARDNSPSQAAAAAEGAQDKLPQPSSKPTQTVRVSGFADLLDAVVNQPVSTSNPRAVHKTLGIKLLPGSSSEGVKRPPALGDRTNRQTQQEEMLPSKTFNGKSEPHNAGLKTFSRRSAKAQDRQEQRKPDSIQQSDTQQTSMDPFPANHQVKPQQGNALALPASWLPTLFAELYIKRQSAPVWFWSHSDEILPLP